MNAAGHEIEPAARRRPAPMAARSSRTKVPRNKVRARPIVDVLAADGKKSGLIGSDRLASGCRGCRGCITLMFQSGWGHAESSGHLQSHQTSHDADQGVVMDGVRNGIHYLTAYGRARHL